MTCQESDVLTALAAEITDLKAFLNGTGFTESIQETLGRTWTPTSAAKYGNCSNTCGSFRVVEVSGLDALTINASGTGSTAKVRFVTCNSEPYVSLSWAVSAGSVSLQSQLRATGPFVSSSGVWPNTDSVTATASASAAGVVMLIVPWSIPKAGTTGAAATKQVLKMQDATLSLQLWLQAPDLVPSGMDASMKPFAQAAIAQGMVAMQEELSQQAKEISKSVSHKWDIHRYAAHSVREVSIACAEPAVADQMCGATTIRATSLCSPCDLCCNCLQQQKCDGDCAACGCLTCSTKSPRFTMTMALAGLAAAAIGIQIVRML